LNEVYLMYFSRSLSGSIAVVLLTATIAQGANTWIPTGSMATTRQRFSLTVLPDGKVLAAGGCSDWFCNSANILSSAEIYNPATGTWSPAGTMSVKRAYHSATLLPNGKVLIAAGCATVGSCTPYNTSEVYDPTTNTWTGTGNLQQARYGHGAVLIAGGKVLAAGGITICNSSVCNTTATAETYDPATGVWANGAPMPQPRTGHTLTALGNGNAIVAGGCISTGIPCTTVGAAVYSAAGNSWTTTASMLINRTEAGAVLLPSGQVLVAGGVNSSGFVQAQAEKYDPATGNWTGAGMTAANRFDPALALLDTGDVIAAESNTTSTATTEIYRPSLNQWTFTANLNQGRGYAPLVALAGGKALIAGGEDDVADVALATAEVYTAGAGPLVSLNPTSLDFGLQKLNTLSDPRVVVVSNIGTGPLNVTGLTKSGNNPNDFLANTNCGTVAPGGNCQITVRFEPHLIDQRSATINVQSDAPDAPNPIPVTGFGYAERPRFWSPTTSMNQPRAQHTLTALLDGRILASGGAFTPTAEVYDSATEVWTSTGIMNGTRFGHTATLLNDGKVLVAGGGVQRAEIFDAATNTWTSTGLMNVARTGHTATKLASGLVLVTGGCGGNACNTTEIFDPATGVWTPGPTMQVSRVLHTATPLAGGSVLLAGGGTATAELYQSGAFSLTGSMTTARSTHTASLLPNGDVLVAGGCGGDPCFTTETYSPASGNFMLSAPLKIPRALHTVAPLADGTLVAASGIYYCDPEFGFCFSTQTAELYTPATGRWAPTFPMINARRNHASITLPNGEVMVTGGYNDSFVPLASAETLNPPR
jgi:N-acetylneuraminic acid mutarotase